MQEYRLAHSGHLLDTDKPIRFTFDGREYEGFEGDTVASALLSAGVQIFGRSFKYHRRRGITAANEAEANALMTIIHADGSRETNRPAPLISITEGLEVESQNRFPSLDFDVLSVNNLLSAIMTAGFYYKTFMGPAKRSWMWFEPFIRRAAGLGKANYNEDTQRYDHYSQHTDVVIIGGGMSGLMAAYGLGSLGMKVLLLEQSPHLGGQALNTAGKSSDLRWVARTVSSLRAMENVTIATETSAFGWYDHNIIGALQEAGEDTSMRQNMRLWRIYAGSVVLATGSMERPIAFGNNDLPNIMLSSALRYYVNATGVLPGRRIVIFANDDSAYDTAIDIKYADEAAEVVIVDARPLSAVNDVLINEAQEAEITIYPSSVVVRALGHQCITRVEVAAYDHSEKIVGRVDKTLPCDVLATAGGWTPTLHLHSQTGCKPVYDDEIFAFVPEPQKERGHFCIGAAQGIYSRNSMTENITETIKEVVEFMGKASVVKNLPTLPKTPSAKISEPLFLVEAYGDDPHKKSDKIFLDMQNDVTLSDVRQADVEGYSTVEHMKRYTTLGMATDQGKTSNMAAFHALADLQGKHVGELGTTTFRPPYTGVPIGALAGREVGRHFRPLRKIPLHDWHIKHGAVMINTVAWQRPWYYPSQERINEKVTSAYIREMENVSENVGLVDVSTLGKIVVAGPDACEFLNRIYVNDFSSLEVGRCRYGVMLRDDGFVMDDGTVTRIAKNEYFVTTTTVEAEPVFRRMQFLLECHWQDLRVHVVSVSDEWCGLALAGPRAREVLHALVSNDVSDVALPFMHYMEGNLRVGLGKVRIFRISFSGELGYELYVRRSQAEALADACLQAGSKYDMQLYGLEAMGGMRLEKGYLTSAEIDGRKSLRDLGLEKMASSKKDFLGKALSDREEFENPERPRLVGLIAMNEDTRFRNGSLVYTANGKIEGHGIGHVTSVTWSPTLQRYIALAFVAGGMERVGDVVRMSFPLNDECVSAVVTSPDFLKGDSL